MAYTMPSNTEYITYEIQDGDTYKSIADKYGITLSQLSVINNFDAFDMNTLYVGSILKVGVREKTTGTVVDMGIPTDDAVEKVFRDASLQAVSVDTATQNTLESIKERYSQTGSIDSIKNDLTNLGEMGYTKEEVALLLNDYSINLDLTGSDGREISNTIEKANESANGGGSYDDSDLSKDTIFGLPFRFNTYADPRRRIYNGTFMKDAAIISMIPGKPLFRGDNGDSGDSLLETIKGLFENGTESDILTKTIESLGGENNDDAILTWLKKSQKSNSENGDLRYYRFKDDYQEFLKYLDLNISTLAVKMGVGSLGSARYKDFMSNIDAGSIANISHAFKFFCTKSGSSTSESISNDFGESQIAGTMNGISDTSNELSYLLGGAGDKLQEGVGKLTDSLKGTVGSLISGLFEGAEGSVAQLGDSVSAAANGSKLIWPQIWKNSTFQRSYNFSFEFISPYGSPEAIFRYVYLPFLTLLTMAAPKQHSLNGYQTPFLVRLDMPGFITSDLSVIQSMSWRKGGNDGLFTNDGLPLAMTVDITVQDLYPNMAISPKWEYLRHNTGMHGFLDNLAGLAVQRFTPWQNIKNSLNTRSVNVLGSIDRTVVEGMKSKIYAIQTSGSIFGSAYSAN